jgi:peptidoglycan/LPS O-acetylase OafA/YrhL
MLVGLSSALLAIICFGIGSMSFLAGDWLRRFFNTKSSTIGAAVALVGSVAILSGGHGFGLGQRWELAITAPVSVMFGIVIAQLSRDMGPLSLPLSRLAPLGAFSYTLYIVHLPLIYVMQASLLGGSFPTAGLVIAGFLGIQTLAWVFAKPLENHTAFVSMLRRVLPTALFRA